MRIISFVLKGLEDNDTIRRTRSRKIWGALGSPNNE